ncbi:MAG TPA: hypothetical protein IGS52_17050 [Oscillatoriaceae cyanobacterium M33_DOE_052]|uniref:Uncharacterized protein n=1 Tax=Planktothricoides sp. SpSt-374 TaxID=2282167 RepID=A0A7C3ZJC7_9CYAN|nr:hypothetical protein [Oscillatoriaceae cyanobacterium M33_DOE_052]
MIHATIAELKQAFKTKNTQLKQVDGSTRYLLLFYVAEIGVKIIYLQKFKLQSTADIELKEKEFLKKHGHNLQIWLKKCDKLPASILPNNDVLQWRLKNGDKSTTYSVKYAHEAWRYGIGIVAEDEDKLVAWLQDLCKWIKENIK